MYDDETMLDDVAVESEQTEKEELEVYIEQLRVRLEKTFNLWTALELRQLEKRLAEDFDPAGGPLDPVPVLSILTADFSPDEAQQGVGYYTHTPTGFGRMPRWLGQTDPALGLSVSNERHAGCVQIENLQATADLWIGASEAVQSETSPEKSSARLFAMAGYAMSDWWFMLPAFDHGGSYRYSGFAMLPEIPYNEDEKIAYRRNFNKYHFGGAAIVGARLQVYGNVVWNEDSEAGYKAWTGRVDPTAQKYRIATVANHPNWVAPAMMDHYNSAKFMQKYYSWARSQAFRSDVTNAAPVPGYVPKDAAYRRIFERTGSGSLPGFRIPGR